MKHIVNSTSLLWAKTTSGSIVCKAIVLAVFGLCIVETHAQQPAPEGAALFAPSMEVGRKIDADRTLPTTEFYKVDGQPAPAQPGTLVRSEPAREYALPSGVSATRILYHSRTANDQDGLSSGVVLVPYGQPPKDGWPLLAWSHGTSGVARNCAPSLMKNLFYNWEGLFEYVMMGYAVVASDYVGLGTAGRHAYIDMLSNGTDVVYSVPAAQAAVPNLSKKWLAIGHSQGGLASLGAAQLEAKIKDSNFLGTVALAGASDLEDSIGSAMKTKAPLLNGLVAFWVYGVKTVYPQVEIKDILTDKAADLYSRSVEDGCSAASGAFAALPTDEMLRPGWQANQYVKQFLARNQPGMQPVYGPLLLIGGGDDPIFTPSAAKKVVERLCARGARVQSKVYPSLSHDPVVYGSFRDQMDWISARFAERPAPTNCLSR